MNKRKRHAIKKEKLIEEKLEKDKKGKLISPIVWALITIVGCTINFFRGKAISDGNMLVIFGPYILIGTIFAVLITWGLIKGKLRKKF